MDPALQVRTERVDDVVLLLQVMITMGLPDLFNQYLPRPLEPERTRFGLGDRDLAILYCVPEGSSESSGARLGESSTIYARTSLWSDFW